MDQTGYRAFQKAIRQVTEDTLNRDSSNFAAGLNFTRMTVIETIKEILDSGDPTVRRWFLVDGYFLTPGLCLSYVIFVKSLGPAIMKNRKPLDLRNIMVFYNFTLVTVYLVSLLSMLYITLVHNLFSLACTKSSLEEAGSAAYRVATFAFAVYFLKYVEFLDTVFFVLRKKDHLITNLHVIHHASLPLISWWFMRTEYSGYQLFPGILNGFIHVVMYSYYGLAALGPKVRQYLWWKKYLTMLQMSQFIIIFLFTSVFIPLSGCHASKYGIMTDLVFALLFFLLFYNFYTKTYKSSISKIQTNGLAKPETEERNGHALKNGLNCSEHLKVQ